MDGIDNEIYKKIFEVEEKNEKLRKENENLRSNINALCELYQNSHRLYYSNFYCNRIENYQMPLFSLPYLKYH